MVETIDEATRNGVGQPDANDLSLWSAAKASVFSRLHFELDLENGHIAMHRSVGVVEFTIGSQI